MKKRSSLFALFSIVFLDNFGLSVVFMLFPALLLDHSYHFVSSEMSVHMRYVWLGILFAVYPLGQFFGAPVLGDMADFWGRKRAFYISIIGCTVGFLFSAVSVALGSLLILLLSRLFAGVFAGNASIALAGIADLSHDEQSRGRNFGFVTTLMGVSWVLAVLVGGFLSESISPSAPFWITSVLSFLNLLILIFFFRETHERSEGPFDVFAGLKKITMAFLSKRSRWLFVSLLFWTLGWLIALQWFPAISFQVFHESVGDVSLWYMLTGLTWAFAGLVINPICMRYVSSLQMTIVNIMLLVLFIFLSSIFRTYIPFTVLFMFAPIFASLTLSNLLNTISVHALSGDQGKAMGIGQSMISFGMIFSPLIGAAVTKLGLSTLFPVAATLIFLGFWILLLHRAYHVGQS